MEPAAMSLWHPQETGPSVRKARRRSKCRCCQQICCVVDGKLEILGLHLSIRRYLVCKEHALIPVAREILSMLQFLMGDEFGAAAPVFKVANVRASLEYY